MHNHDAIAITLINTYYEAQVAKEEVHLQI